MTVCYAYPYRDSPWPVTVPFAGDWRFRVNAALGVIVAYPACHGTGKAR